MRTCARGVVLLYCAKCSLCAAGYFKSITGVCQPCHNNPVVGMSIGLIVGALLLIFLLYKCVVKRLGKWARQRMRAFGKIVFVFIQIIATLPTILQMPLP